jgi:hypothetical protein
MDTDLVQLGEQRSSGLEERYTLVCVRETYTHKTRGEREFERESSREREFEREEKEVQGFRGDQELNEWKSWTSWKS